MNIGTNIYQRFCVRLMIEPCDRLSRISWQWIMCYVWTDNEVHNLQDNIIIEYVRECVPNYKETKLNGNSSTNQTNLLLLKYISRLKRDWNEIFEFTRRPKHEGFSDSDSGLLKRHPIAEDWNYVSNGEVVSCWCTRYFHNLLTSVKLKNNPIEPETKKALSMLVSSLGRHGEQAHPGVDPVGQQILLTVSQDGWSSANVELNPQQLKVLCTSALVSSETVFQPSSAKSLCWVLFTARQEHAMANWTMNRQNKMII